MMFRCFLCYLVLSWGAMGGAFASQAASQPSVRSSRNKNAKAPKVAQADKAAWAAYLRGKVRVKVALFKVPWRLFRPAVREPSDDYLVQWIRSHKAQILAYYTAHPSRYKRPKKIRVRHILIRVPVDAPASYVKRAKHHTERILGLVKRAPTRFAEAAKMYSQGPTRTKGGDLGYFTEGTMVKPFSDAAFALKKKGDLSPVVRTRFGFHIIQLVDSKPPSPVPFLSAQLPVAKKLWRQEQRNDLLSFALQWIGQKWQRYQGKKPFLHMLKAHFADAKARGRTPNVVLFFWRTYKDLLQRQVLQLDQRHQRPPLPAKVLQAVMALRPSSPVSPKPIRSGPSLYLLRLLPRTP